ncbi:MAG: peptidoglycan recognition protein [Myxococcales bacterium]|nr:peptidoglycan recognition protein [Myxococcales bacterium]
MRFTGLGAGLMVSLLVGLGAGCVNEMQRFEYAHSHDHQELTATPESMLASWTSDGDWLVSPRLDAIDGASRAGVLVGLLLPDRTPTLEARLLTPEGPGPWLPLDATWSDEDQLVANVDFGDIGTGAELRVRVGDMDAFGNLRFAAVIPEALELDLSTDDLETPEVASAAQELRSELQGFGIVTRAQWGARATRCTSRDASKRRIAVHHTVTSSSDPARQMRGMQNFHMNTRGWCDIGYHFLIGADGRLYEGRPLHLLGTHVGGQNSGNIGISFIGCYHTSGCSGFGATRPTDAMVRKVGQLMGSLRRIYGINLSTSTVMGHGQHAGQSTTCPGANVRSRIGEMINIGRSQTLSGTSSGGSTGGGTATGGSCRHTYGGTYGNLACSASYQCCNGSWRARGACGSCACVESTGQRGCSAPSGPPAGAACTHTYGGRYANTACSPSYQCCNGSWRTRGSCGSCYCTESTGQRGCGT